MNRIDRMGEDRRWKMDPSSLGATPGELVGTGGWKPP